MSIKWLTTSACPPAAAMCNAVDSLAYNSYLHAMYMYIHVYTYEMKDKMRSWRPPTEEITQQYLNWGRVAAYRSKLTNVCCWSSTPSKWRGTSLSGTLIGLTWHSANPYGDLFLAQPNNFHSQLCNVTQQIWRTDIVITGANDISSAGLSTTCL